MDHNKKAHCPSTPHHHFAPLRIIQAIGAARRRANEPPRRWVNPALKAIETVAVGDLVCAWSEETRCVTRRRVMRLFRRKGRSVVDVLYAGADGEAQRIVATTEHPFWVEGKGWVPACELAAGDVLKRISGGAETRVQRVVATGDTNEVFNFEVDGVHNYFVGEVGVLVHNASMKERLRNVLRTLTLGEPPDRAAPPLGAPAFDADVAARVRGIASVPKVEVYPDANGRHFLATVPGHPASYVLGHVPVEGVVAITELYRGDLPQGTGAGLLAKSLVEARLKPRGLVIEGIAQQETIDVYRRGGNADETPLGKTGRRALELLGLRPTEVRFEPTTTGLSLRFGVEEPATTTGRMAGSLRVAEPWVYHAKRDPISSSLFNGIVAVDEWRVSLTQGRMEWTHPDLGYSLGPRGLAALAGLPDGARMSVESRTAPDGRLGIGILARHPVYMFPADIAFFPDASGGKLAIGNVHYNADSQGRGLGTRAIAVAAHTAAQFGIGEISLTAVRSSDSLASGGKVGYDVWARLGFDAKLTPQIRRALVGTPIEAATTVLEATSTQEGRRVWRDRGETWQGSFDLSPGSRSWDVLNKRLASANIYFRP